MNLLSKLFQIGLTFGNTRKIKVIPCSCCGEYPKLYKIFLWKYQLRCNRLGNLSEECIRPAAKWGKRRAADVWNRVHTYWRASAEEYFMEHHVHAPWAPKMRIPKAKPVKKSWRDILGPCKTLEEAKISYRKAAKIAHPDTGGSHVKMIVVNNAWEAAQKEFNK